MATLRPFYMMPRVATAVLSAGRAGRLRSRRGFSMLELLTVFVIAGVISGLSIGKLGAYMMQQRVVKASAAITNDLQQAFALAGRTRRPVRIVFDTTTMQMSITDRAQTTVMRQVGLGAAYGLTSKNIVYYPSAPLEIYPNGLASDTMAIRIQSSGTSRYVWVSRAGMVQVKAQ